MPVPVPSKPRAKSRPNRVMAAMNVIVMTLSVVLIAWISLDTFKRVDILTNHPYMTFQFWVCDTPKTAGGSSAAGCCSCCCQSHTSTS